MKREFILLIGRAFVFGLRRGIQKMQLKSCPHCQNSRPYNVGMNFLNGKAKVVCLNCGMSGPLFDEGDYCFQNASEAWNKLPRYYSETRVYDSVQITLSNEQKQKDDLLKLALKDVPRGTTFSVDKKK